MVTSSTKNYSINGVAVSVTATNDSVASPTVITFTAVGVYTKIISTDVSGLDTSEILGFINQQSAQMAADVGVAQDTGGGIVGAIQGFGP